MNYDIKLYVHGVPNGQKAWGLTESDRNYINTFYGRKSEVPAKMLIEIKQFGSSVNCYYTYYRANDICDCHGRQGSYVALTLRLNYYYTDIQNIYNLLDAAYNKFIVGSILNVTNGISKYCVPDFAQASSTLETLEQEMKKYMMQFSVNSDFIPLNGFKSNTQGNADKINLLECNSQTVDNHVKSKGCISISPFYPSSREQNIKSQAEASVKATLHEKEQAIQAIKNEYKNADKTISSLRQELAKYQSSLNKVQNDLATLQNEKKSNDSLLIHYKAKYDHAQTLLNDANQKLNRVYNHLSGLQELNEVFENSNNSKANQDAYRDRNQEEVSDRKGLGAQLMKFINKVHPFVDFFVILVLVIIVGFTIPKLPFFSTPADEEFETNVLINIRKNIKYEIDIVGIKTGQKLKKGKLYTVNLIGDNNMSITNGTWLSPNNTFKIDGNKITSNSPGECTIAYIMNGEMVAMRKINAEK